MMGKMESYNELTDEIVFKRNQMIETGLLKGLSHQETVKQSQELDELINRYQSLFKSKDQPCIVEFFAYAPRS
ncbi:aspartyl-phosphate phosphatase Spo0E family protein [Bacillus xiapuensis]|uniref:aspartyl-phosphate phosphatase Spo0E family protein n=1 Tax=Bacillus xiapuensis TaxID=2014075 RepID=UPI001E2835B4|nr:aspartyl-phosphate phosphatase Spo0E family protein [Bacillus xiapuensis]